MVRGKIGLLYIISENDRHLGYSKALKSYFLGVIMHTIMIKITFVGMVLVCLEPMLNAHDMPIFIPGGQKQQESRLKQVLTSKKLWATVVGSIALLACGRLMILRYERKKNAIYHEAEHYLKDIYKIIEGKDFVVKYRTFCNKTAVRDCTCRKKTDDMSTLVLTLAHNQKKYVIRIEIDYEAHDLMPYSTSPTQQLIRAIKYNYEPLFNITFDNTL